MALQDRRRLDEIEVVLLGKLRGREALDVPDPEDRIIGVPLDLDAQLPA
jgi:hypothetical protein